MKIVIQGHPTRGKEVIQILESLGGKNLKRWDGNGDILDGFFIDNDGSIEFDNLPKGYKLYTLEEFEKEFPFKIGDEVIFPVKTGWASGKITGLTYVGDQLKYEVDNRIAGYRYIESHKLSLYPMKEERNITLTLDKAKEWYKKGGELKEIALQAFSEKELTKVDLPKTWKEFCENYPVRKGESWLGIQDAINVCDNDLHPRYYKNWIPSKKSAEAHLAMIQLEQLRNCWRNGWEPNWNDGNQMKYCVRYYQGKFKISILSETRYFLSFPTMIMAEEFLKCFRDLIEKAGDLI